jgi:hypothetical protein
MVTNADSTPMLTIEWGRESKQFDLTKLDLIEAAIEETSSWPVVLCCRDVSTVELLEILSPLTELISELVINDIYVEAALNLEEILVYIPSPGEEGVRVISAGSSSWLPGGPCVMEQHEEILCFEDLYWVEASGDSDQRRLVIGRLTDEKEAIRQAVKASLYFYFDDDGNVMSELDDGPQEQ